MAAALIWMTAYAYTPILPAYAESLGATPLMIGVISGSYGIFQFLLRTPLGLAADKPGRDKFWLVIGYLLVVLSAVIFIVLPGLPGLLIGRTVAGAAAAWWVTILIAYGRHHPEKRQIKAQGEINASGSAGKLIASILSGLVAQFFSYSATFVMALVFSVMGLATIACLKPSATGVQPREETQKQALKPILKNRSLMLLSAIGFAVFLLSYAIPTTFAQTSATALGANSLQLGVMMLLYFIAAILSSLFLGTKLYHRLGSIKTMTISLLFGAASSIPMLYTISIPAIYLMQVFSGLCFGVAGSLTSALVLHCVEKRSRGAAMGVHQAILSLGIVIGPLLTGTVIQAVSFDAAFWMLCAVSCAAAAVSYFFIPRRFDSVK